jgi:hypothetical protein
MVLICTFLVATNTHFMSLLSLECKYVHVYACVYMQPCVCMSVKCLLHFWPFVRIIYTLLSFFLSIRGLTFYKIAFWRVKVLKFYEVKFICFAPIVVHAFMSYLRNTFLV